MTKPLRIFQQEAYLVPLKSLDGDDVDNAHKRFLIRIYNDKKCDACEYLDDRHSDTCDTCSAFVTARQMSKVVEVQGKSFLSMPLGGWKDIRNWLTTLGREPELYGNYPDRTPFSRRIAFTKSLYDYQVEARDAILKGKVGLLKSPPRSGKTVIAASAVCKLGSKALILASQHEWLSQFRETFIGSETVEAFTDAEEDQVKICRTYEDFVNTDVCLATFSTFFSDRGKKLLAQIRDLFTIVIVDEVHFGAALQTSRVIAQMNSEFRIGMSGTIERKVTDEIRVVNFLFGRVLYASQVDRVVPTVHTFVPAGNVKEPKTRSQAGFTAFQTRLEANTPRKESICRQIIKYANNGHLVLVPMARVDSVLEWARWINAETGNPGFALPFYGGLAKDKRMQIVEAARNYKCRVLIGSAPILTTGLNIPRASCLFEVGATSNVPKAEQRYARVCTPMAGKPPSVIVYCIDNLDLLRACRRKEFFQCMLPRFKPKISKETYGEMLAYLSDKKNKRTLDLRDGL